MKWKPDRNYSIKARRAWLNQIVGAHVCVQQVSNWTLDARKFEVDFTEYSVAPRAAGPVSITLSWQELKPYLARCRFSF